MWGSKICCGVPLASVTTVYWLENAYSGINLIVKINLDMNLHSLNHTVNVWAIKPKQEKAKSLVTLSDTFHITFNNFSIITKEYDHADTPHCSQTEMLMKLHMDTLCFCVIEITQILL